MQELEKRTGCRVRSAATSLSSTKPQAKEQESARCNNGGINGATEEDGNSDSKQQEQRHVSVSVRCNSGGTLKSQREKEARCRRAAELICNDRLSLEEALKQTDAETAEMERLEAERREQEELEELVRRMMINWPEFEKEDAKAALLAADRDEDAAFLLLQGGFKDPEMRTTGAESEKEQNDTTEKRMEEKTQLKARKKKTEEVHEEFPALFLALQQRDVAAEIEAAAAASISWRAAAKRRHIFCAKEINCAEEFPGLPAPSKPIGTIGGGTGGVGRRGLGLLRKTNNRNNSIRRRA